MKTFKELRVSRFQSQFDFAHDLLMDQSHYGRLERGMVQPRLSTVCQIAEILDLTPQTVQRMIDLAMREHQAFEESKARAKKDKKARLAGRR